MPWKCIPVDKIRHLAPAALAALIAAHPIPAGMDCYCKGTSLAWVPDGKVGLAPHAKLTPTVPLPADYSPPFGYHGPLIPIVLLPYSPPSGPLPPTVSIPSPPPEPPPTSVPEPSSGLLLLVALGLFYLFAYNNKRKHTNEEG